jgi:hypothetical protein
MLYPGQGTMPTNHLHTIFLKWVRFWQSLPSGHAQVDDHRAAFYLKLSMLRGKPAGETYANGSSWS